MTDFDLTAIPTVAVPVTDQERALSFYVEVLGFQKHMDVPLGQIGGRWITVGPAQSATTIALVPASEDTPAGVDTGIRITATDAPAAHRGLVEHGVDVDELLQWDGVPPMFGFRDRDGNRLVIVEQVRR
ncbi:VOC family protein [Fodinicola acaciae]|uniref:VOC family protein n=1 Tax=Fodinicola acaciae TaxID=2681555 RepID=UPI0013D5B7A9|nr:VOC family protein [Fodinicola acaciae]